MKNTIENKKTYFPPQIEHIILDNEISLILESTPPVGPFESINSKPDYLNNNPFKLTI